jgi:Tfp pilus assembly protein PilV
MTPHRMARSTLPPRGFGTIEILVALSLFSVVVLSLGGLFLLALSSGASAESASIAANLARARLEVLHSLPPSAITGEDGRVVVEQVPPGQGRPYTVHTSVDRSAPGFLDVTVTVSWQVAYGSACAAGTAGTGCAGKLVTQSRTLETRIGSQESP